MTDPSNSTHVSPPSHRLRDHPWQPRYSHEDGDLVRLFYEPALACATTYRRVTGYFSADALALAARGLEVLIQHGGRMQLLVGCTLQPREIEAIERGYDLRKQIEKGLIERIAALGEVEGDRERLGWLAWMIAENLLDLKVAVPKDEQGRFRAGLGLYHAKIGILEDAAGDVLVFEGSINETYAGWRVNVESFSVSGSWYGEREASRVASAQSEFDRLWENRAKSAEVLDFPEACRLELLKFLPTDDQFVRPPVVDEPEAEATRPVELSAAERCRLVWQFIADAPRMPHGALVAVKTSTVTPWPHQLRAYKRMLDAWPCRLLIADEVGLGKTIEAGLILRHTWISGLAKRILILAPKAVLKQWQGELYEKFNLLVPIYTEGALAWPEHHGRRGELEVPIERSEWTKTPLVLASSHLVRRQERQQELLDAEDWDLVVLDEAHHARRKGAGSEREKGPNRLLGVMRGLQAKTKSLLLLTATPMQVAPVEIWDLVALLGLPSEWSAPAFVEYFELLAKNPDADGLQRLARMFQATERAFGSFPEAEARRIAEGLEITEFRMAAVLSALREPQSKIPLKRLDVSERRAALACLRVGSPLLHRMSRHTRSLLREYFKRGLLDSPIADRDVVDIPVDMSPAEQGVYSAVEDYISKTYAAASPAEQTAVGFVMTVYRRRMASSFHALRCTLNSRLARLKAKDATADFGVTDEDASQDERADEVMSPEDAAELAARGLRTEQVAGIQALFKDVATLGVDSKARRLVSELQASIPASYDAAIVFTQYTDTLDYLRDLLAEQLDIEVGCYSGRGGERKDHSGSWRSVSKESIKRLLVERQIRILICTDAAAEGLNLQSVGMLVNYDLPWNPMKVEQRIGRIDRIGQTHAKVRILNLAYKDTVEADVYFSLSERIGLFQGVVGKLQPILSQVARQFEGVALMGSGHRDQACRTAVNDVTVLIDRAHEVAFDIDEVSEADLRAPGFPDPPFLPADLDDVLADPELVPPGVERRTLHPSTYAMRFPGSPDQARVTTDPVVFDEHFESHQLCSAGSPVFESLVGLAGVANAERLDPPVQTLRELLNRLA